MHERGLTGLNTGLSIALANVLGGANTGVGQQPSEHTTALPRNAAGMTRLNVRRIVTTPSRPVSPHCGTCAA